MSLRSFLGTIKSFMPHHSEITKNIIPIARAVKYG